MIRKNTKQSWDEYWNADKTVSLPGRLYSRVASFYRNRLIGPRLNRVLSKNFDVNAILLHAGSGAGEVDQFVPKNMRIIAVDISPEAIHQYKRLHKGSKAQVMDIFDLPGRLETVDGIYNLGVMEHFSREEVSKILNRFNLTLKPGGKLILFWPPTYGLSVVALHLIHGLLKILQGKNFKPLHPEEPNKLFLRTSLAKQMSEFGFKLTKFSFSIRDAFTYIVVVATKI